MFSSATPLVYEPRRGKGLNLTLIGAGAFVLLLLAVVATTSLLHGRADSSARRLARMDADEVPTAVHSVVMLGTSNADGASSLDAALAGQSDPVGETVKVTGEIASVATQRLMFIKNSSRSPGVPTPVLLDDSSHPAFKVVPGAPVVVQGQLIRIAKDNEDLLRSRGLSDVMAANLDGSLALLVSSEPQ